jgi:ATP-binding cassette, subfamily C (CFTR/MRP), member 1
MSARFVLCFAVLLSVINNSDLLQALFQNFILDALQDKTRILVTHQLSLLPRVDKVIVLRDCSIVEQGTYPIEKLIVYFDPVCFQWPYHTFEELMRTGGELATLMKNYADSDRDSESPSNNEAEEGTGNETVWIFFCSVKKRIF